jgi:hypothetical protein
MAVGKPDWFFVLSRSSTKTVGAVAKLRTLGLLTNTGTQNKPKDLMMATVFRYEITSELFYLNRKGCPDCDKQLLYQ